MIPNAHVRPSERAAPSFISRPLQAPSTSTSQPQGEINASSTRHKPPSAPQKPTANIHPSMTVPKEHPTPEQQAALRGASLAFGKPKPPLKPKPSVPVTREYTGNNGALTAATISVGSAGQGSNGTSPARGGSILRHGTGSGRTGALSLSQHLIPHQGTSQSSIGRQNTGTSQRGGTTSNGLCLGTGQRFDGTHLQLHDGNTQGGGSPEKSASFIAATLAAEKQRSRSREITPHNPGGYSGQGQISRAVLREELKRTSSFTRKEEMVNKTFDFARRLVAGDGTDTESIPATTSLIQMFEQQHGNDSDVGEKMDGTSNSRNPSVQRLKPKAPLPLRTRTSSTAPQKLPKPDITTKSTRSRSPQGLALVKSVQAIQTPMTASRPILVPARPQSQYTTAQDDASSSNDSFVSASSHRPSIRVTLQDRSSHRDVTRRLKSYSTPSSTTALNSLADAIVASSLASSRAASPSRPLTSLNRPNQRTNHAPPPPPPRLTRLFHNRTSPSRTPSPAKTPGLRSTMRKPPTFPSPTRDTRPSHPSKTPHLLKKHHHPHKHSEATRRRWHSTITPTERKRYEAVWASNRGLLVHQSFPAGSDDSVCNLVVREIWARSKAPVEVLEEVYELVDRGRTGWLGREEFVVGLWLVDGWLRGRKLPVRVGGSVWGSVGGWRAGGDGGGGGDRMMGK